MSRIIIALTSLLVSFSAFAEPLLYVCERPAWGGKTGCGPNDTYDTHTFLVDTLDFDSEDPTYVYQGGVGCDVSNKAKYRHQYVVTPETIEFHYARLPDAPRDKLWASITVDRETMKGVMSRTNAPNDLNCRVEKVD